jgi:hypothetical protein
VELDETINDPIVSMLWGTPGIDSANRLGHMLDALILQEGDAFWRVFATVWPSCDDTWDLREELLRALDAAGPGWEDAISPEDAAWFAALPDVLTIHRGCSIGRVFGASWTVDKGTAISFAKGHRMIKVPDPVVATARVSKREVLFATNRRHEAEVLVDPWIKRVTVQPLWAIKGA